ncbi:MAG: hypothetical protein ACP5QA_12930 [Phycisphaerae bacterium]
MATSFLVADPIGRPIPILNKYLTIIIHYQRTLVKRLKAVIQGGNGLYGAWQL